MALELSAQMAQVSHSLRNIMFTTVVPMSFAGLSGCFFCLVWDSCYY
ncbi:MAG: hypothetical protein U1F42_06700 [Candidatus Competibacteraceae bacterium]